MDQQHWTLLVGLSALLGLAACQAKDEAPDLSSIERIASSDRPAEQQPGSLPVESSDTILQVDEVARPTDTIDPATSAPAPAAPVTPPFYPANCLAIKKANANAPSGVYKIYLDPTLTTRLGIDAACDMITDGGGWTLFLNYSHKAITNPNLVVRTTSLPLLGSEVLGEDESLKAQYWGHAGNALLTRFSELKELRFYCRSSENARVLHFKTSEPGCLMAVKTGSGSCLNIKTSFNALTGHTANLPGTIDRADSNKLDEVLTYNTFGSVDANLSDPMWNIRGDTNLSSWECDFGSDNPNFDTIHRIWFR